MGAITSYRDLHAWQVGMDVVDATYRLTAKFPREERYGLVSQMRRAAMSIPSNVAEGQAVESPRWSLRHIVTAIGSSAELQTQLEACCRLGFATRAAAADLEALLERLQKLLYGLRRAKLLRVGTSVASASAFILLCLQVIVR
jgi:four helix bundle protein